jgi:hypothetical protein
MYRPSNCNSHEPKYVVHNKNINKESLINNCLCDGCIYLNHIELTETESNVGKYKYIYVVLETAQEAEEWGF